MGTQSFLLQSKAHPPRNTPTHDPTLMPVTPNMTSYSMKGPSKVVEHTVMKTMQTPRLSVHNTTNGFDPFIAVHWHPRHLRLTRASWHSMRRSVMALALHGRAAALLASLGSCIRTVLAYHHCRHLASIHPKCITRMPTSDDVNTVQQTHVDRESIPTQSLRWQHESIRWCTSISTSACQHPHPCLPPHARRPADGLARSNAGAYAAKSKGNLEVTKRAILSTREHRKESPSKRGCTTKPGRCRVVSTRVPKGYSPSRVIAASCDSCPKRVSV
jgi:hypothetical protein